MRVHFIAIGGSAMHNLAIALHLKGFTVSGSDDEIFEPSYTRLNKYGLLPENIGWDSKKITDDIQAVILGMHARADNPELLEAQRKNIKIYSYPEFLFEQSKHKMRVVIGGSHGKTTITSMILHVLQIVGFKTDYMVGAQLDGFEVMVKLSESAKWMVMEGDEYLTSPIDRVPKFLHYHPNIAVISGIGWDHINVFPTFENYVHQFKLFIDCIEPEGSLIFFEDDIEVTKLAEHSAVKKLPYSIHPHHVEHGVTIIHDADTSYKLSIFGRHNMANLSAAHLVCKEMGVSDEHFYNAISSFKGASRRLELFASNGDSFIYRDFAHAPSKVKASIIALKEQFSEKKIIACLELHTFSSLSEGFINQYRNSLDAADVAIVFYDPHAVALKRLPEISFQRLREAFGREDLYLFSNKEQLISFLLNQKDLSDVYAFMSSGSFNGLDLNKLSNELGITSI
ncbi:MAG: peptidoglycan synthetase [Bacteroidetes bacterium HGW-Bacteroidetes-1]|jgi:UDP-N-acetylmuramate: L-alanyl-gamma-D-glutamyl-meso-diaminopimelate ligase|nr:MAG: peptidoglycan synthetase [Bacteroidetes bacterium HGW-Bacteroidetes-1]